jgi:hypothetical protein
MVQSVSVKKSKAIKLLGGGSVSAAAQAMGVSYQAIDKWPENLPRRIADRVLGAYVRLNDPEIARLCDEQSGSNNTTPTHQESVNV